MSKRILVVEDHEDNRQIIRDMLSATDYVIMEAESGEAALAFAGARRRRSRYVRQAALQARSGVPPTRVPFAADVR